MKIAPDASVLVKRVVAEEDTPAARRMLDEISYCQTRRQK